MPMAGSDDLYMLFSSGGFRFGIPIPWVQRTAGADEKTQWPVWDFSEEKGGCRLQERKYLIFLERKECRLCLAAEEIEGIWQRETAVGYYLSEPVVWNKNRYLEEAVFQDMPEEKDEKTIFLLNPEILYKFVQERSERQESGRQPCEEKEEILSQSEEVEEEERELEDCLEVRTGDMLLYVDKESVRAVVGRPKIWEIPQTRPHILGISFYEGSPVIYYRFEEVQKADCGIIIRAKGIFYAGIAAQTAGTQRKVSGRFVTLMPGVWVKKE